MIRNATSLLVLATLATGCTGSALDNAIWFFLLESLDDSDVEGECTESVDVNFDATQCEDTDDETFTEEFTLDVPSDVYFAEIIDIETDAEEKYKKLMILQFDNDMFYLFGRKDEGLWVFEWNDEQVADYSLSHNSGNYVYTEHEESVADWVITLDIGGGVATGSFSIDTNHMQQVSETDDFGNVDDVFSPEIQDTAFSLGLYDAAEGCDPMDRIPFLFEKDDSECTDPECTITFTEECALELELIGYLTSDDGLGATAGAGYQD